MTDQIMRETEVLDSLQGLEARRAFWESQPGRVILPFDNPENGSVGHVTFKNWEDTEKIPPEDWNEDNRFLVHYLYGKPLVPEVHLVNDSDVLENEVNKHRGHVGFRFTTWPEQRQLGFVCYCQAAEDRSIVVKVNITFLKGISLTKPDLFNEIYDGYQNRKPSAVPEQEPASA